MLSLKNNQVDTRGRSCPEPVLLTKKVLDKKPAQVEVLTDSSTARDNIIRLAENQGYKVSTAQQGADYILTLTR